MVTPLPFLRDVPNFQLEYDLPLHTQLPHVVKFSGGRSSAMMLMLLLYNRLLDPRRGDVIIFNNTSAEANETYKFMVTCKRIAEEEFNIPFFIVEFQTYEDVWMGKWRRVPSFRLAKPHPHCHYRNRTSHGYRHKGEIFEEFVSWQTQLPTRFNRTCTQYLKLQTTKQFLEAWFGRADSSELPGMKILTARQALPRLGHYYDHSMMPDPHTYGEKEGIVRYHLSQKTDRTAQRFQDYTSAKLKAISNDKVSHFVFGGRAVLKGAESLKFLSLVGLRADEQSRVVRILQRNNVAHTQDRMADGEYLNVPLFDLRVGKREVLDFWTKQDFDLSIPHDENRSNCVYCFMKGPRAIRRLAGQEKARSGPASIRWWAELESKYARAVKSRNEEGQTSRFGFFGVNSQSYADMVDTVDVTMNGIEEDGLPCECTD